MASEANPHGRVDDDGTVLVHDRDTWRPVGSFPDGTPAEALAYFERKFQELEAKVTLAEQRLAAKAPVKDLAAQIDKLTQDLTEPAAVGDLGALRHRAQTLQDALPALVDAQKQESEAALQEALATRETIVKAMEELAAEDVQKIRWKAAGARITELFDQWQKHQQTGPRIPKKTADVLWARFRTAKNALEKARRSHFQELEAKTKESKNVKKALIEQAEALAPQGSSGIAAYQKLLTQWKAAPRAQRSVEDALWAKFKAAGDVLYQQKAEQDAQEDKANAGNLELKLSLISDFGDILTLTDRDVATTRLRLFHEKFSAIGPVPKKD
ncbi:MAG: DUF349 domain-containing protein, partial [Actinomycetota bacterium]|nr:DUF349 domain-containing protein [Actinomycetota bacterium]